ncbi:MAG: NitT/TauT family transport system substrate-binding protein [Paracoccaceae bacterium]|jgi:NitT/TauT family transport system substrate-binding protein
MTMTRRQTLAMMAAAAAAAGLGAPALARTKTVVGALKLGSHAATYTAYDRGYFSDNGLEVELKYFDAAQPMAVAIASGDVDFGITSITGGLVSLAEKGAVKVIGGALSEEKGISGQMILASNEAFAAGATDPSKLAGKRWGVTQAGSSFHYMGSKIAQAGGFGLEYIPLQKVGAIIGALKSNQIDAWTIVPNVATGLVASGAVHHIGMVADFLPDYQVTTVFTSAKNAAEDRAKTQAFLAAFSQGVADFNAAMVDKTAGDAALEDMIALIHKYIAPDKELSAARAGILAGAMRLNGGASMNVGSIQDQLDWFKAENLIKPEITFETVVDTSYVKTT